MASVKIKNDASLIFDGIVDEKPADAAVKRTFESAKLGDGKLELAVLRDTVIIDKNPALDMRLADLRGADFTACDDLSRADFAGANLARAAFAEKTIMPGGLTFGDWLADPIAALGVDDDGLREVAVAYWGNMTFTPVHAIGEKLTAEQRALAITHWLPFYFAGLFPRVTE